MIAPPETDGIRQQRPALSPLVSLRSVSKTFDNGTEALRGFSLDAGKGQFLSLLGPSGCGKSTALRILAGLAEPSVGTVEWHDGLGPASLGKREIGFVFQEPTLMPWASVFDNVWLPLRLKGVARAAARDPIIESLAMVGLESFAESYPRELSGGMRMRVSIARALVTRPQLLLMDEPFAALDEITRFRLNDELLSLWQKFGWTVVFVTHSVFESVYLSERIVVMTARPGRTHADIAIEKPYPRSEAFRLSPAYNDHCRQVSDALHAGMES